MQRPNPMAWLRQIIRSYEFKAIPSRNPTQIKFRKSIKMARAMISTPISRPEKPVINTFPRGCLNYHESAITQSYGDLLHYRRRIMNMLDHLLQKDNVKYSFRQVDCIDVAHHDIKATFARQCGNVIRYLYPN